MNILTRYERKTLRKVFQDYSNDSECVYFGKEAFTIRSLRDRGYLPAEALPRLKLIDLGEQDD